MSIIERTVLMTNKDAQGNTTMDFPITKVENVEGLDDKLNDSLPVGTIIPYAGNITPTGYLDCSGASLNPNTYTRLFGVIGTTYGGDGVSTFNLPNLKNNLISDITNENITIIGTGAAPWFEGADDGGVGALCVDASAYYQLALQAGMGFTGVDQFLIWHDPALKGIVPIQSTTVKYCIKY